MTKYINRILVDAWEFDGRLDFSKTLPKIVKDEVTKIRLTQHGKLKIQDGLGESEIEIGDMVILHEDGTFSGMDRKQFDNTYVRLSD